MKKAAAVFVVIAGIAALAPELRSRPAQTAAADLPKAAYLIRLGVDGVADTDWSGSIEPAPSRLTGWQFDTGDAVEGAAWKAVTKRETYWDTPYERSMGPTSRREKVTARGVIAEYDRVPSSVRVVTKAGSFSFDGNAWRGPQQFLDGRVEVAPAPAARALTSGADAEDFPALMTARDGTVWLAWQSYESGGDRLYVRRSSGTQWSAAEPVSEPSGDYFRPQLAQDARQRVWLVWAAQVKGNVDLYARRHDGKGWSATERLTTAPGPDLFHSLAADSSGNLLLAWQAARGGNFDIYLRRFDGSRWSEEMRVSDSPANDWEPFVAAGANGPATILWDTYERGNYDVVAREYTGRGLGPKTAIAASGAMEARASASYDRKGALWIVFDEGDWNWGKDYGNGVKENGRGLLVKRQVRVAVRREGRLLEPAGSIAEAVPDDFRQAFQQPRLVFDAQGNPWVFFRYRVNTPVRPGERAQRAMWRAGGTVYREGKWAPMIEFPEGYGRIDAPAAAALQASGALLAAYPSDGREWPFGAPGVHELYTAELPSAPAASPPSLRDFAPSVENLPPSHAGEDAAVARVRSHRAQIGGKELRIVRGDVHRHTDVSWDGNRDGSLHDAYRYALDAAAMDYLGVCDHQGGNTAYNWWLIQKAVDLFTIPGRFAPLYSYERSLPWPNGHRNVLFAERGRPILEIAQAEVRGTEGAGKLYAYLRKFAGITSSHTSATGAGTDWRDSDAALEPVVEIYQGYRTNYEGPGTPRAARGAEAAKFAAGFVWNAWAKGIKLGVQSSSDHVSTHISYAAFYVDRVERSAILDAARARRAYAATDNFIIDLRMGSHFMGDVFKSDRALPLQVYVRGAGDLASVEVIRNNRVVYSAPVNGAEARFEWTDSSTAPGESYYYVRAQQRDGQLGWSSPVWVTY
jgi:hypothetical protein